MAETFGQVVRRERLGLGLSLRAMCARVNEYEEGIVLRVPTLCGWESGRQQPPRNVLMVKAIAHALKQSAEGRFQLFELAKKPGSVRADLVALVGRWDVAKLLQAIQAGKVDVGAILAQLERAGA